MPGRPVDQTHNHFIENIISPPTTRLTPEDVSGVQTVRRVGPVRVTYEDGLVYPGFAITSLDDGVWVLKTSVHVLEYWNGADTAEVQLIIDNAAGDAAGESIGPRYNLKTGGEFGLTDAYPMTGGRIPGTTNATADQNESSDVRVRGTGLGIYCLVVLNGGDAPTEGAIDVYALIAEPSA